MNLEHLKLGGPVNLDEDLASVNLEPEESKEDEEPESPLEIPSEIAADGDGLTESESVA
jgi:hypothetical protein